MEERDHGGHGLAIWYLVQDDGRISPATGVSVLGPTRKNPQTSARPQPLPVSFRPRTTKELRVTRPSHGARDQRRRFYKSSLLTTALTGSLALLACAASAQELPTGGEVTAGRATITRPSADQLNIVQLSDRGIITWDSFSIGAAQRVDIAQPDARSTSIQQVTGQDPSRIFGALTSNGNVVVANPNGIWFGRDARVDVAGIVATTASPSPGDADIFMSGGSVGFSVPGHADASVVNAGSITVAEAGIATFVAPGVANSGVITARLGRVNLAAASRFSIDLNGDGLVSLAISDSRVARALGPDGAPLAAAVSNAGRIQADGGAVLISADVARGIVDDVIDMSGVVQARSVESVNGEIVLLGGSEGNVSVGGVLDASGRGSETVGGTVKVLGDTITIHPAAVIDVSGGAGGGQALIGGNIRGAGPEPNAGTVFISAGARIAADAGAAGDGGTVAIWGNRSATFRGEITARGGAGAGLGGFVETSSPGHLDVRGGRVDTRAADGAAGLWLLDPTNVTISTAPTANETLSSGAYTPGGAGANILNTDIEAALVTSNVTIETASGLSEAGNIAINAAVSVGDSLGNARTLTLNAAGAISGGGNLGKAADQLTVRFNQAGNGAYSGVIAGTGGLIKEGAGTLTLGGTNTYTGATSVNAGTLTLGANNVIATGAVTVDGAASVLNLGSFSDTVGAVTLANGARITGTGTLSSTASFALQSGSVSAKLGGSVGATKTTSGTVTLSGANTYTGATTVSDGTLAYGVNNAIAGGAVTVNGAAAILDIGTFTDTVGTVTLAGGGGIVGAGTLSSTATFAMQSGTVSAKLGGGVGLTKSTAGTVTLSGVNTYTGATTVSAGTLAYGVDNAIAGGAVTVNGATAILNIGGFTDSVGTVTLAGAGNISGSGTLTSTSLFAVQSGAVSANLAGGVGLTKSTTGTVTLTGANTYTGATTIGSGVLSVSQIGDGGTAGNIGAATSAAANLILGGGTLRYTGAAASTDRAFTLTAATTSTIEVTAGELTISGAAAATTGALTKTGAGTLTLSGANAYTGITRVNGGVLSVSTIGDGGTAGNIGAATSAAANLILGGGTLRYTGAAASTDRAFTLTAATTSTIEVTAGELTISGAAAATTGALTKTGAGTLTLSGANAYTGLTTITNGSLAYGANNALSTGAVTVNGASAVLNLGTFSDSVGAVTLAGGGSISGTGTLTSTASFALQSGTVGANLAGAVAVTKTTAGTVTLSGANTYTGATALNGGVLKAGSTGAFGNNSAVTIANTAGANLDLNGFDVSVGSLAGGGTAGGQLTNSAAAAGILTTGGNNAATSFAGVVANGSGSVGLTKIGAGTFTLTGANSYTGVTSVNAGVVSVGSIGNGGVVGNLGAASAAASNLVLGGGTLSYIGASASTDRAFTLANGTNSSISVTNTLTMTGAGAATSGGLTKIGAGTLVLSGASAYTGATVVNAGILSVSNIGDGGAASGIGAATSAAANLVLGGGTLRYTGATASTDRAFTLTAATTSTIEVTAGELTVSGAAAATTGALTKTGAGTLVLTGANAYTGITRINAGVLSAPNIDNGGAASGIGASTSAAANLVLGGGALRYTGAAASTDRAFTLTAATTSTIEVTAGELTISGAAAATTGALTKTGAGILTLSGANAYTGITRVNGGVLSVSTIGDGGTAGNIGAATSAAANLILGGGTLRYTGATASTNRGFTLTNGTTSTFDITANTLTFSGASASSTGALTKSGAGTLTLSAANAYTGLTTITNGTLAYGINNTLSSGAVTVNGASAVLDIGAFTDTVGAVTLAGGGAITGAGLLTSTATFALQSGIVSARLGGAVGVTKTTAGTVTLGGANTYTGTTTVSEGTLAYGANNAIAAGAVTVNGPAAVLDLGSFSDSVGTVTLSGGGGIAGSGTLTSTGSFALQSGTVSAVLAGTVALNKTTAGTVTLSAANNFSGLTTVSAGALAYGANNALGTGGVTVTGATAVLDLGAFSDSVGAVTLAGGGAITGTGTLTGTAAFALQSGTVSANLAGAVALNKTGSGTVTLSGSNSFSGLTTISAGTLAYGANDALGTGGVTVTGATSVLSLGAYSDTVGTLTLSGGAVTGSGTLTSTGSFALQSGAVSANLAGAAGLTKTTTGAVTLTGTNSYTGATTVSAGTLQVGNGAATGTLGSGAVSNAATLIVNRSDSLSLGAIAADAGGITGTGALTIQAGGSLAIDRPITLTGTGNVLLQSGSGGITLASAVSKTAGNVTLVTTGAFTNNAGAGALTAGGRWLVYSAVPANDTIGGLAHAFKQYNAAYGATVLGAGNGFIYAQAPVLTIGLTGSVSKTYDRGSSATLTAANYAFTGAVGRTLDVGSSNDTIVASGAAPTSAAFDTAQAGAGKTVTVSGLSNAASGSPGSVMMATNGAVTVYGYTLSSTSASGAIGTITQASLTATLTGAVDKTYDSTTAATLAPGNYMLSGVIGGDAVSVTNPSGGSFDTASAGTGKTVTVTGLALSGASAANYTLTSASASGAIGTITPASLTAALTGTVTKTYDATTAAALTAGNYSLAGVFAGDTVTLNNPTGGAYGSAGAGSGKTVTVTGLSISGANAANYSLTSTSVSGTVGTITPASVTAALIGTVTKTYDATTTAALTAGNYSLSGVIGGDTVTLNNPATGDFDTAGAGAGKTISASGLVLSGSGAANYALTSTSAAGAIGTIDPLRVIFSGSRAYDGTTAAGAAVLSVSNNLDGANLTLSGSGTLAGKNVGSQALAALGSLSLGGSAAGNYSLVGASGSVAVAKATLTFSGITVNAKVYDRTAAASLNVGAVSLGGVIGADAVAVDASGAAATFADKNVGTAKAVTISGLTLTGADAANYQLGVSSTTAAADITAKSVTVAGITANDKVYDGTAAASLNTSSATLGGVISGDAVSVGSSGHTAAFADKNVGAGKVVTVSGVSLSGGDAGNYVLAAQPAGLTAAISSRSVTASISVADKTYDGSVSATVDGYGLDGALGSDSVALNVDGARFADKNAGSGKTATASGLTLSGADAGNYTLTSGTAATTATIAPRTAAVLGIAANGKIYDGTTAASVDAASAVLSNIVAGDSVILDGAAVTAVFTDKNAGAGKTVRVSGFSLSGNDASNYLLTATSATATADISRRTASISGIAVNDKVYDATREATLNTAGASVSGVIAGDAVTVDTRNYTAAFADADAGAVKSVAISGLTLAGADAGNYRIANTSAVSDAAITRAPLSIVVENQDRIYGDPNPTFIATMAGLKGSDTPLVVGGLVLSTTATQASGAGAYAITASGAAAANYAVSYVPGTLTIARAPLLIAANDQTMVAGSAVPPLTVRYSGFRLADTAASVAGLRLSANMTASSPAGTYSITPSDATAENYEISYANGVMTVTPAQAAAILAAVVRPPAMPSSFPTLVLSPTGAPSSSSLGGGASTPGFASAGARIPAVQPSGAASFTAGAGVESGDGSGAAAFANGFLIGVLSLPDPPIPLTTED